MSRSLEARVEVQFLSSAEKVRALFFSIIRITCHAWNIRQDQKKKKNRNLKLIVIAITQSRFGALMKSLNVTV